MKLIGKALLPLVATGMIASAATGCLPVPHPPVFRNCTALHVKFPHGVGLPGAVDHVRGSTRPVTTFYRSAAIYQANKVLDADRDGIACERL